MSKLLPIPFPIKGIHRTTGFAEQPPLTTVDAVNVIPFDAANGRRRGGLRPGLAKWTEDDHEGLISLMQTVYLQGQQTTVPQYVVTIDSYNTWQAGAGGSTATHKEWYVTIEEQGVGTWQARIYWYWIGSYPNSLTKEYWRGPGFASGWNTEASAIPFFWNDTDADSTPDCLDPQASSPTVQAPMPVLSRESVDVMVANGTLLLDIGAGFTEKATGLGYGQASLAANYTTLYVAVQGYNGIKAIATTDGTTTDLTATAGDVPENAKIIASWRDRLLVVSLDDPQNLYASRAGTATDWDTGQEDPQAAWTVNDGSDSGRQGAAITALIPASNDLLIVGCDGAIWCVQGDPADGGAVQSISRAVGIMSHTAWCTASDGMIYFVGQDGLYMIPPGQLFPQCVSNAYRQFFTNRDHNADWCLCIYDRDRDAVLVLFSPVDETAASDGLWFDRATGGVWKISYPAGMNPTCGSMVDADDADKRQLVFGCRDGYVRYSKPSQATDDGTNITNYLWIGPIAAEMSNKSIVQRVDMQASGATLTIHAGDDFQGAILASASATATLSSSTSRLRCRVRGQTLALKLTGQAGTRWAFERGEMEVSDGGFRK